jgi:hypothetical protein
MPRDFGRCIRKVWMYVSLNDHRMHRPYMEHLHPSFCISPIVGATGWSPELCLTRNFSICLPGVFVIPLIFSSPRLGGCHPPLLSSSSLKDTETV